MGDVFEENPGEYSELSLEEFKGTLFRWSPGELTAIEADAERILIPYAFTQMIYKVYLADLNGDGLPEFCASINYGSGVNYWKIVVFDYGAGKLYELNDHSQFEYALSMKDGQMLATQTEIRNNNSVLTGRLAIIDDKLVIIDINQSDTEEYDSFEPINMDFMPGEILASMIYTVGEVENMTIEFQGLDIVEMYEIHGKVSDVIEPGGGTVINPLYESRAVFHLELAEKTKESVLYALEVLKLNPEVICAQPNYIVYPEPELDVLPPVGFVLGDIDGDGVATMADAMFMFDYISGKRDLTPEQILAADIDKDGSVTMADFMRLFDYLSGKRHEL